MHDEAKKQSLSHIIVGTSHASDISSLPDETHSFTFIPNPENCTANETRIFDYGPLEKRLAAYTKLKRYVDEFERI